MLTQSQLTETAAQLYRDALVASLAQGNGSPQACADASTAVRNYRHCFAPNPALPLVPTRPGKWWRMIGGAVPSLVDVSASNCKLKWRGELVHDDGSWRGPLLAPGESWAPETDPRLTGLTPADAYRLGFDDAADKRLPETPARRAGPAAVARYLVDEIVGDLDDRSGLGFDTVEEEIKEEIVETWTAIARKHLRTYGGPALGKPETPAE